MPPASPRKPIHFLGSSLKDLREMREVVRGTALKGLRGILELRVDHAGDTYRAMCAVRFTQAIYVLHVFQKKSKKGIETPRREIDVIRWRLRQAESHYRENYGGP